MRPTYHVLISGGVTAIFSIWVKSWMALGACFLSGIFIDLDHHLDYFLITKKIPISYEKLAKFHKGIHSSRMFLFFHAYEWLIVLWICIFVFDLNAVWLGIAIGCSTHVLCDEFANPLKPLAYFLTYRVLKKFDRRKIFKRGYRG